MHVLLIAGGWSSERKVSLAGAEQIEAALRRLGHRVSRCDPSLEFDDLARLATAADFAFLNLHGAPGEDGLIQALLERTATPYQGSGPAASFLALNKALAKQLVHGAGIRTPEWEFLPFAPQTRHESRLRHPLFVKPNSGGSSLGLGLCETQDELDAALAAVFAMGDAALIEEAASGQEVTCAVLGGRQGEAEVALPPILIRPRTTAGYFDYEAKYQAGRAEEICPAPITPQATAEVQRLSLAVHRLLGLEGYSRSDFIMTPEGFTFLEVNTLPGMTATSLVPQAAQAAGLEFDALVARLMDLGLRRAGRQG